MNKFKILFFGLFFFNLLNINLESLEIIGFKDDIVFLDNGYQYNLSEGKKAWEVGDQVQEDRVRVYQSERNWREALLNLRTNEKQIYYEKREFELKITSIEKNFIIFKGKDNKFNKIILKHDLNKIKDWQVGDSIFYDHVITNLRTNNSVYGYDAHQYKTYNIEDRIPITSADKITSMQLILEKGGIWQVDSLVMEEWKPGDKTLIEFLDDLDDNDLDNPSRSLYLVNLRSGKVSPLILISSENADLMHRYRFQSSLRFVLGDDNYLLPHINFANIEDVENYTNWFNSPGVIGINALQEYTNNQYRKIIINLNLINEPNSEFYLNLSR